MSESGVNFSRMGNAAEEIDVAHEGPPSRDTGGLYNVTLICASERFTGPSKRFGGHSPSFALPEGWSNKRGYLPANKFAVAREASEGEWRRGESEYSEVLKTRKLLKNRRARKSKNAEIAPNWNVSGTRDFAERFREPKEQSSLEDRSSTWDFPPG